MVNGWMLVDTQTSPDFATCLRRELQTHPALEPVDVLKFAYQAAWGCEHFVDDYLACRARLIEEFNQVGGVHGMPLTEALNEHQMRVNLAACRERGIRMSWILRLFFRQACPLKKPTQKEQDATEATFRRYLSLAGGIIGETGCFPVDAWERMLASYKGGPVSHSETYRRRYSPHYRVLSTRFLGALPILEWTGKRRNVGGIIALEGRCGAGKSTIAQALGVTLDCSVVRMDDFFLPPALRTPERLNEAGGNVDYERFAKEVVSNLGQRSFAYSIFDCARGKCTTKRLVGAQRFTVVEGSYSRHPRFGDYADLSVFVTVSKKEQMERILARNGEEMARTFATRWIPMEERYFAHIARLYGLDIPKN